MEIKDLRRKVKVKIKWRYFFELFNKKKIQKFLVILKSLVAKKEVRINRK